MKIFIELQLSSNDMEGAKSPRWLRIAEIILGAIAIGLAGFVLSNPDFTVALVALMLSFALIIIGISNVLKGAVGRDLSKGTRGINIGIGVLALVGGFVTAANPLLAVETMILLFSVIILLYGFGLVGSGISSRTEGKVTRTADIIIGGIVVGFGLMVLAMPGVAIVLMVTFLALSLLIKGIASIISGITGNTRFSPVVAN
jgi:uncharacterized membrane protein HdeD (DUF308 family)